MTGQECERVPETLNFAALNHLCLHASDARSYNLRLLRWLLPHRMQMPMQATKIFVNGIWVGVHRDPQMLVRTLRQMRRQVTIIADNLKVTGPCKIGSTCTQEEVCML